MKKGITIALLILGFIANSSSLIIAQQRIKYKQVDSTSLFIEKYQPENLDTSKAYPAMIFYFGGGWNGGSIDQFKPHAMYFSQRGMICFLAEYRVNSRNHTSPFESLKDAKSAFRFIRAHAKELNIDPNKIVASGGSAGGHLAAALATIADYNEHTDDLSISCLPNALVLYNPVIDNGPGGYGYERIQDDYKTFSPLHNIKKGAPASIIFLGTNDPLIPVETAKYYKTVMEKVKSRCDLFLYEGQKHGFFNYKNIAYYKKTVYETNEFLKSIGYLQDDPVIEIK